MNDPCIRCVQKPCQLKGHLCKQKKQYIRFHKLYKSSFMRERHSSTIKNPDKNIIVKTKELGYINKDTYIRKTVSWYGNLSENKKIELNNFKG